MDNSGSGSTLAGVIGIGVFVMVAFGVLLSTQTLSDPAIGNEIQSTNRGLQSESLAQLILDAQGRSNAGGDWIDDPDDLARFGLLGSDGHIDFKKLENLRLAKFESGNDGHVNYGEALAALGNPDLDFHIRAQPTMRSVRDILATGIKEQHLQVAYIGDIAATSNGQPPPADPLDGLSVTDPTCSVSPLNSPMGNSYRFSVDITNGGEEDTQFNGVWTFELGSSGTLTRTSNTYVVADDGGTTTLYLDVPAYQQAGGGGVPTACKAGTTMSVEVLDVSNSLTTVSKTFTASDEVTASSAAPHDLFLSTDKTYYVESGSCNNNDKIELEYGSTTATSSTQRMAIRVVDSSLTQVFPTTPSPSWHDFTMHAQEHKRTVNIGCLPAGQYTATFQYYSGASPALDDIRVTEKVLVTSASLNAFVPDNAAAATGTYTYFTSDAAAAEVAIIERLTEKFCPYYFDSSTTSPMAAPPAHASRCGAFKPGSSGQQGDVFPDVKDIMNNDLPARLLDTLGSPRYDETNVLIVGSDVQHNVMTSASAKHAVRDWVYGGGTLIVLGSIDQSVQWLQPIFHSGIVSSSGGIGTPDATHPVLRVPDVMDWQGYGNPNGNSWDFNAGSDQYFTTVVNQGTGAVLAVSNPGAFQKGNVFLTTYIAHDPYGTGSSGVTMQGNILMNNLMSLAYRDLYLDYGPAIPDQVEVTPGVRTALVYHPDLEKNIAVTFVVFVF